MEIDCPECKGKKVMWYEWSNGIAVPCETCQVKKYTEAEVQKLRDALSLAVRELKTAMVGYRRAANKTGMKGYDLAESTLWDMFNFAVNNAETILKDDE